MIIKSNLGHDCLQFAGPEGFHSLIRLKFIGIVIHFFFLYFEALLLITIGLFFALALHLPDHEWLAALLLYFELVIVLIVYLNNAFERSFGLSPFVDVGGQNVK